MRLSRRSASATWRLTASSTGVRRRTRSVAAWTLEGRTAIRLDPQLVTQFGGSQPADAVLFEQLGEAGFAYPSRLGRRRRQLPQGQSEGCRHVALDRGEKLRVVAPELVAELVFQAVGVVKQLLAGAGQLAQLDDGDIGGLPTSHELRRGQTDPLPWLRNLPVPRKRPPRSHGMPRYCHHRAGSSPMPRRVKLPSVRPKDARRALERAGSRRPAADARVDGYTSEPTSNTLGETH